MGKSMVSASDFPLKIIGKSLVSIGKSIVHWKIIGKSIEMMENPWFSIEDPLKIHWKIHGSPRPLYVADLALYHQIALMQRTFPVRLSRWGESMQQAQALPAAWGLVHVFFFFPRNWVFIIKSIVFQCVFFLHQD